MFEKVLNMCFELGLKIDNLLVFQQENLKIRIDFSILLYSFK